MAFFGPPPSFVGATTTDVGTSGLVPAPQSGINNRYLASNSTFKEPIPFPQYKTTDIVSVIVGGFGTTILATGQINASVRTFNWIYAPASGSINTLIFRTGAAPSPAFNGHVALWRCGEDGKPSTYIIGGTGSSGTSGSTDIQISVSSTSIESGLYYISLTTETNASVGSIAFQSPSGSSYFRRIVMGMTDLSTNPSGFTYTCATSYSQTTHETFLTNSVGNPVCGFKYA